MGTSLDTMVPAADGSLMPRIALPCAGSAVRRSLCRSSRHEQPFRHWRLREVLPTGLCAALTALPFAPPEIDDTLGKRDTHNALRVFIDEPTRTRFPACAVLAETFQDEATTALLSDLTGRDLDGSFLRIEYCLDTAGFWLEPHTDIGAKLFTLLIYLSDHPDAENWGTDLMDKQGNVLGRSSGAFNRASCSSRRTTPGTASPHGRSGVCADR
jgi:hypothetical protein